MKFLYIIRILFDYQKIKKVDTNKKTIFTVPAKIIIIPDKRTLK